MQVKSRLFEGIDRLARFFPRLESPADGSDVFKAHGEQGFTHRNGNRIVVSLATDDNCAHIIEPPRLGF